ncbi:hypothetical protein N9N67_06420 [Bacteriovoracaceae bacterium]|nr:hypothetical protein [Bacteriovoracaceae bacterium]
MIKVLTLSSNKYFDWLTYEMEYLNDAFQRDLGFDLKSYGAYRPDYDESLNAYQVIEKLYGISFPDVVLIDISILPEESSKLLFEIVKILKSKSILIFKTADPWRQLRWVEELEEKFSPDFYLVHSKRLTNEFNKKLIGKKATAHMFPYCFGRRYFDLGLERKYDIGLIGRCQLNGELLSKRSFRKKTSKDLSIFYESSLTKLRSKLGQKNYLQRYAQLILNLNLCKSSWNSPVAPKGYEGHFHTPFRYVEAPACGAISITPTHFEELNEYYYPPRSYFCCDNDSLKARDFLIQLKTEPDSIIEMKNLGYDISMGNHQAENRTDFIKDLIKGNESADVRDHYKVDI